MSSQTIPPTPMTDLTEPLVKIGAIIAAGQLGLFKVLAEGPRSISEIANATGGSETGVARLAEELRSVGYLERVGECYANGPTAYTWLTPESQVDFSSYLLWLAEAWHLLEQLSHVIRNGGPERTIWQTMQHNPEMAWIWTQYSKATAQQIAEPIVQAVVLPDGVQRLLDLGGSHGLQSIAFCQHHPNLKAVVFDFPAFLTETEQTIAAEGLANRVSVQRGDYFTDDVGQGYDVILCFEIIHNHTENDNRHLIAKAAQALNPGGLLVIYDLLSNELPDTLHSLVNLIFFMESGSRTYSYKEITGWLADAEFTNFNRINGPPTGGRSIIRAVKPS